ncbi:dihydrodipicolinate synthase family protein [Agromyces sp. ISL-38]|uniref:dihydrodipicolinate synthase family protein n=1 Tax=Agromyces sp. ISL-38 TaxID=2819107 RepID=UPI001BE5BE8C|nr:dihydrodipicolinate synthase family protein [Agromyces sp. ISL-38]MBT2500607.1 dihydrodipicolinate synthase family protein [Agromyces sp. ISL-38]MBT2516613.1 dihydrodipicolinate synthase family protein [Streptomyces sp. ISL-90]
MTDSTSVLADVVAIPVTPFHRGDVDLDRYGVLLRRIVDAGVRVVTPNGNTSEFYALTPEERRDLLRVTAEVLGATTAIVAGIGHDIPTAIAEGTLAAEHGAAFAMIHQPVHPYVSRAGWVDYHATIAAALRPMGIVLYVRNPWVTADMLRELLDRVPNLVGIKYAVPDAVAFARIRQATGADELTWIAGLAEPYALSYTVHGAVGFTSGLVNVNPGLSLELLASLKRGDLVRAAQLSRRIDRFEQLRAEHTSANNVSVIKEALYQLGLCSREVRAPSSELDADGRTEVAGILVDWGSEFDLDCGTPRLTEPMPA